MSFFNAKSDSVDDRQGDNEVTGAEEEIIMTEDLITYNNYEDFGMDSGVDFNIGNDEEPSGKGFFGYLSEETQESSEGNTIEYTKNTNESDFFSLRTADTQQIPPVNSDYISSDSSCSSGEGSNKKFPEQVRPKSLHHAQSRPSTAPSSGRVKSVAPNSFKTQLCSPPGPFSANPFASTLQIPFASPPPLVPPPRPITAPAKPIKLPQHTSLGIADPSRFAISSSKELFPTPMGVPGSSLRGSTRADQLNATESVKLTTGQAAENLSPHRLSATHAVLPVDTKQDKRNSSASAVTPFTPASAEASSRGEMSPPLAQMRRHPTSLSNSTLISPPETVLERHMSPRSDHVSALPITIEVEPTTAQGATITSAKSFKESSTCQEALQVCAGMDSDVAILDKKLRAAEVTVHAYKVDVVAKLKAVAQLENTVLKNDKMCTAVSSILAAQHRLEALRARWKALLQRDHDSSCLISDCITE